MFYQHTRSLGPESGVQLNPVRDDSDGYAPDGSDQVAAIIGRFRRGRIDAPFAVNRGNFKRKLGAPESLRVSALNEAYVQASEAVNNGAAELVVSRLSVAGAKLSYAVFAIDAGGETSSWTVAANAPASNYLFYLKDLECFNDGVKFELTAEAESTGSNKVVTLRVLEPDGTLRWEFTGSLDPAAVDEYNQDFYLGSKIEEQTDLIEIVVAANAAIPDTADCYGTDALGAQKWSKTEAPLILFTEGGTGYQVADYDRAVAQLENGTLDFGYGFSGGSESVSLLSKFAQMCIRANRQFEIDIPGDLTPDAAITFINQLGIDHQLVHAYWAPLRTNDPVNGGKGVIGLGGYQVALRCARNAVTNSYGLANKHYPVAGMDWPINRTGVRQIYTPDEYELKALAKAKINPVIFQKYTSSSRYVFLDSLTMAKTEVSLRKLISVAEMSSHNDDMVVRRGKELLQRPMEDAIKKMEDFLEDRFKAERSSGWLVPSAELGDSGYAFKVERDPVKPADHMIVTYSLHYDGVARAITITQTISR